MDNETFVIADLSEQSKSAIGFASEISKQLITLAAGVLALSFTFLKDLAKATHRRSKRLLAGWSSLVISMSFGVLAQMTLAGHLARKSEPTGLVIYEKNTVAMSGIQILSFFGGLCCLVSFAWAAIDTSEVKLGKDQPPRRNHQRGSRR